MSDPIARLHQTIATLEAQRGVLGDEMVELALGPVRERLATLIDAPAEQQLRQVSVLFVDVVGSTSLSQHLSPEEINAVMDGSLAGFTRIVQANAGEVLQYAGDSMLAVFGKPVAREDDAERAVRAGLAILAQAREQAERVKQRHGHTGFGVRAGIATGGVLLGGGVDGAQSIRGMTVNLAARLEQAAPPGTLRICPDTRRQVRGLFNLFEQPPLQVKGRDEPVVSWLADGVAEHALAQATRGVGGVAAPLVGRTQELATLMDAWHEAGSARPPSIMSVTVMGEAGLGKSRLAAEIRDWARAQGGGARCLDAFAGERDMGRPYGLLRQVFARQWRILDSDPPAEARSKWLAAMTPLLRSQGDAAVLGHLLGLDFAGHNEVRPLLGEGRQLRDRGFFHAAQALQRMAAEGPRLLLWLDDLHWADPGTLEFIDHLAQQFSNVPVFLLATARPELDELHPQWADAFGRRRITLAPLDGAEAQCLADALLLPFDEVPADLRERLTSGAAGNPFFMEELVNMMVDRGVIVSEQGAWTLKPERLHLAQVPSTLAGVLQARLDLLPAAELHALQLAAVVGPVFWDDSLRALGLAGELPLQPLVQRQLIAERSASSLEGRREFAFRHHLMHEVCYGRVLERIRLPAHARLARWLEGLPGQRPFDLIAQHFERGGEPARARDAWHRAAELAQARYANAQALAHAGRAQALTMQTDLGQRYALALLRAQVLALQMQPEPLRDACDELERLAEQMNDDARRSEATDRRARSMYEEGHVVEALRLAETALGLAPPTAPQLSARASALLVQALGRLGRYEQAQQRAADGLAWARQAGDKHFEGAILNELGLHADDRGDFTAAIDYYRQALTRHRETENRSFEAGVLSNLGYCELGLGDYIAAESRFSDAREQFARIGQREKEAVVLLNLALTALNRGQPVLALERAEEALPILRQAGSRWAEGAAIRMVGQANMAIGRAGDAMVHLAAARDLFDTLGMPQLAMEACAYLAQAALKGGDRALALEHARSVLDRQNSGVSIDGTEEPIRVQLACWEVLRAGGDERAGGVLQAAHQRLLRCAAGIGDESRRARYLHDVPHHRLLIQAWNQR